MPGSNKTPREKGLSIRSYAAHRKSLGLSGGSKAGVEKAIDTGRIVQNEHGRIDPEQADAAWAENTDSLRAPAPSTETKRKGGFGTRAATTPVSVDGSGPVTYGQSRAIKEAYQAKLARLDYEQKAGKLVNADKVRVESFQRARHLRDRVLGVSRRVAIVLADETDAHTIEQILDKEIRQALEELANE